MYSHNLLLERSQRAIVDGIAVFFGALVAVWIRNGTGWFPDTAFNPWPTYLFPPRRRSFQKRSRIVGDSLGKATES